MKTELILSGVGGQGLVSTGEIIGQAASIFDDLKATMTAAYGSETRGTFTKTDVILSDGQIGYPNVSSPDIILCLAQVAYDRYQNQLRDDTLVFYDTGLVTKSHNANGEQIGHPFREMSLTLGSTQTANIIALGAIIKRTGLLKRGSVIEAIRSRFSGRQEVVDLNCKALELGLSL